MDTHNQPLSRLRRDLLDCFRAGVEAVDGRRRVREVLTGHPVMERLHVVAIGKAAAAMSAGALDAWDHAVERGLVISKPGHIHSRLLRDRRFTCIESAHPVPDGRSLQAGRALVTFLDQSPEQAGLLFLISGGASSLVEVLAPAVSLADLERVNTWLLGSGLEIAAMNAVRQGLSAIKGGRLTAHLRGRKGLALLISDVQGDDPHVIGSGLLVPGNADRWRAQDLPDWLTDLLQRAVAPSPGGAPRVDLQIIATLQRAMTAASARGGELGYRVVQSTEFQHGDACAVGRSLAERLLAAPPVLFVWGGETTVQLPPDPGRGGRCQALALCAAQRLTGRAGVALLAAGTDGSDGPGEDAGAVVDGETLQRGADAGLDAPGCLAQADAGRFLEGAGDLIHTGPTGTNVMDLMIGGRVQ